MELLTSLSSILEWCCAGQHLVSFWTRGLNLAAHLCFGTRCQLCQMRRSTVFKNLSFRILVMFGEFGEPLMLSSKVIANGIISNA